jgi:cytochrome c oxidase accessory protein FixG
MLDEHSVVVTYRSDRGEPRGKAGRGAQAPAAKLGDCIDCSACVTVCPTGIDIRNGQQLECINCGLCVDACDHVMDKVDRPRGLIALDTLANLEQRRTGVDANPKLKIWRPRVFVYMALWAGVGLIMLVTLLTRANLDLSVQRDRNPLFVTLSDGSIRNGYTFHLINKLHVERQAVLSVEGLPDARLYVLNQGEKPEPVLTLGPDAVTAERIFVTVPRGAVAAESTDFRFVLRDPVSGDEAHYDGIFRGPGK